MKKKNIVMMMCATALLSSCHIYKAYDRPEDISAEGISAEGIYRDPVSVTDTLAVTDTTNIGSLPWQEIFRDPKLQVLIEEGLANNVDMQAAILRVEEAKVMLTSARLSFLPSINFAPQGSLTTMGDSDWGKAYSTPLAASWEVDLFGKLLNGLFAEPIFATSRSFANHLWNCQSLLYLINAGPSGGDYNRDSSYL